MEEPIENLTGRRSTQAQEKYLIIFETHSNILAKNLIKQKMCIYLRPKKHDIVSHMYRYV